jgi:hypothetical protein
MGTNFYMLTPETVCSCCGRGEGRKHIGKSSAGWCFSLHVYPEEGIRDLSDWEKLWATHNIEDEHGNVITVEQMLDCITERSSPRPLEWSHKMLRDNFAVSSPHNLVRHQLRPDWCIGHGAGTWDLLIGDFS